MRTSQLKIHMLLFLIHRLWKFMVYWGHFLPLFSVSFLLCILQVSVQDSAQTTIPYLHRY